MISLSNIMREGRNSITEMYNELKIWINNPASITDIADTAVDVNNDNNIDVNAHIDDNDNKSNVIISSSDVDTNINAGANSTSNLDVDNDKNNNISESMIQQRLRLLIKWLDDAVRKFTKEHTECSSRYAYVILCGLSSSILDYYNDTKQIIDKGTGIDESRDILESNLYQLLKYSVSKKKQSLREKDYQQIEKYISRFEKKEVFNTEKLNKWRERLQQNENFKSSEVIRKPKKNIEIDYEVIYKYSPSKENISDFDFFKTCEILNVLCHELKVNLDIELTAFEILNRICLQLRIASNEIAFVATSSLLLSSKICSTHHHHVSLNKILHAYWKLIGDLDESIEYVNENKRKKNLALKVTLPNDNKKTFFLMECLRFEKLALLTLEFELQISPPTIVGGALEKFIDVANLQSTAQQSVKTDLGQCNYKFSALSLTADPMIIIAAIYLNICVKSKDKSGSTKIAEIASSLMLSKDEIDEVYSFLKMQNMVLNIKYSQLENEAAIINLESIKYKVENNNCINSSNKNIAGDTEDINPNPFLIGSMDIHVNGSSEVFKHTSEKNSNITNTERGRPVSPNHSRHNNKQRDDGRKRSRSRSQDRKQRDGGRKRSRSRSQDRKQRDDGRKRNRSRSQDRKQRDDGRKRNRSRSQDRTQRDGGRNRSRSRSQDRKQRDDGRKRNKSRSQDRKQRDDGRKHSRSRSRKYDDDRGRDRGREQKEKFEIFVRFPPSATSIREAELRTLFEKFGNVIRVHINTNDTGKFAFIGFDQAESCNAALLPANKLVVGEHTLHVEQRGDYNKQRDGGRNRSRSRSQDRKQRDDGRKRSRSRSRKHDNDHGHDRGREQKEKFEIFVRFPPSATSIREAELRTLFEKFGNVIRVHMNTNDTGKFAFIRFDQAESYNAALLQANKLVVGEHELRVEQTKKSG